MMPLPRPQRMPPTRRELEVLDACLTTGSLAGAAHALGIGQIAASWRLRVLYGRLGVQSRSQAVAWLYEHDPDWRRRLRA